jgi:hypothetical protein
MSSQVMSKNKIGEINSIAGAAWPGGYFIEDDEVRRLEGRLLTIVEAVGLPTKQEEALKGLVRQEVWQVMNFWVTSEQITQLKSENRALGQSIPS